MKRIFVLDDEENWMNAFVQLLSKQGYEARGFTLGQELLDALDECAAVDAVLLDNHLYFEDGVTEQDQQGFSIAIQIAKTHPDIVRISIPRDASSSLRKYFDGIFSKNELLLPQAGEKLVALLKTLIG